MKKIKQFIINAALLSAASIIMRTVGVSFNAYVADKVGADGMGLFSLIMSVYTFAVTFAVSGVSLAATRMVSEAIGRGDNARARAAMRKCLAYSLCFGCTGGVVLFFASGYIGRNWLLDARTIPSLRLLALSLPPIALSSAMSGYFVAVRRVYKNALTQFFEQAVRIILVVNGLMVLLPGGIEYACIAVVGGGAIAEFASFLFLSVQYAIDRRLHLRGGVEQINKKSPAEKPVIREMLSISLPVAFAAYARSGLITLEHILIPICLQRSGSSRERSLAAYGTLHSMVFPVLMFPSALLGSFSSLLVPELAECRVRDDNIRINYILSRVFRMTLLFAVGISGLLICFSYDIGMSIYSSREAVGFIRAMAPLIPVMYLDGAIDAMLKGLGEQVYSMRVNIIDSLLSVLMVWLLLPKYGIWGYVFVIYFCELINATMSIKRLLEITSLKTDVVRWLVKPLGSIIGATSAVKLLMSAADLKLPRLIPQNGGFIAGIAAAVVIYALLLLATGAVTGEDTRWLGDIFKRQDAGVQQAGL